ncbi:MAG: ATP-binding cassette domain-containing protein [Acidimicrobiia bacterium]|nr:MAG: ATP-binding cassette domain-containing protein [Acidimicrobiia bacterium]
MIEISGLSFGYKRGEPIIDGLDWAFPAGRVTGITGRSGSGKSTLLYLLGLLLSPLSGRIAFDGEDLGASSDRVRSRVRADRIGFVFQDAALDSTRSVLDNIIEGSLYTGMRRRVAVARAGELMVHFDVGLRAAHKPGEVSGGQAQRVALCRALLNKPRVVLADEPTGNLDTDTARVVINSLVGLAHADGATVVIASHDPKVVAACDEVLAL